MGLIENQFATCFLHCLLWGALLLVISLLEWAEERLGCLPFII
jgi:hypothetical protein